MAFFLELNCHKANVHACIKATVKWLLSFESCSELTYIQRVPRMFRFIRVTQMFVLRSGSPVVTLRVLFYCILKWHFYLFINFFCANCLHVTLRILNVSLRSLRKYKKGVSLLSPVVMSASLRLMRSAQCHGWVSIPLASQEQSYLAADLRALQCTM